MDQGLLIERPKGPIEGEKMVIIVFKAADLANIPSSLFVNDKLITVVV